MDHVRAPRVARPSGGRPRSSLPSGLAGRGDAGGRVGAAGQASVPNPRGAVVSLTGQEARRARTRMGLSFSTCWD